MDFRKITLNEAIEILENDKTSRLDVYFVVGNNHSELNTTKESIGTCVRVDRGQISNIRKKCCELATMSLFGGIFVRA